MRVLDLFCGEGGAGHGYAMAGHDVTGVDLRDTSERYPYRFVQGDALAYAAARGADYELIHASPPCQAYSALRTLHDNEHPDLIDPTRAVLQSLGVPWIMENVPGAPMRGAVVLCGSMFGLGARCEGKWRQLRRHRLFESSMMLSAPGPCRHNAPTVGVYGSSGMPMSRSRRAYQANGPEAREAMGTPWMTHHGCTQAIPPAYTQWLASCLVTPPLSLW